jgi:uncharacterized protein involved in type VI secretion and phage assembly
MAENEKFYSKYRGVVTSIEDPLKKGRIRAHVPDVLGDHESGWAMPCAPFGGKGMGFFALPTVNAGVWIEFEKGDPDYPIWTGCWWGSQSEMASDLGDPPYKKVLIKTAGGHSMLLDDTEGSGGITLKTSGGQKIIMNDNTITIDNGKGASVKIQNGSNATIELSTSMKLNNGASTVELSMASVSVNNGALEVM